MVSKGVIEINLEDRIEEKRKKARSSSARKRLSSQKKKLKNSLVDEKPERKSKLTEEQKKGREERKNERRQSRKPSTKGIVENRQRKTRSDTGSKHKKRTIGQVIEYDKKKGTGQAVARLKTSVKKTESVTSEHKGLVIVNPDQMNEQFFRAEYTDIFNTLRKVGTKLESQMEEKDYVSSKDIYAMSTLFSQIRETIADLRSITDASEQTAQLINEILKPFHRSTGSAVVSILMEIRQSLHRTLDAEKANRLEAEINNIFSKESIKMQDYYENSCDKIAKIMEMNK